MPVHVIVVSSDCDPSRTVVIMAALRRSSSSAALSAEFVDPLSTTFHQKGRSPWTRTNHIRSIAEATRPTGSRQHFAQTAKN
jgi:hypothetical protein